MMIQTFQALLALLEQEESIYSEMATLLEQEREALLAMKVDRLGQIASRKETLGLRIKAMDESRKMLSRRLGAALGLESDKITLTVLSQVAPADVGVRLGQIGQKLKQIVLKCQAANEFNARAACRGLDLVSGAIEYLIAQADPAGKLYQAPKKGKALGGYGAGGSNRFSGPSGFISRQV